jgi:hypothetical protein
MSALEVTLGVLLMVAVITIVWLVVGGRFIMRRLERQIRALQVSERNALHLAHLWQKRGCTSTVASAPPSPPCTPSAPHSRPPTPPHPSRKKKHEPPV